MRDIDHIFIIWTGTDVMDETRIDHIIIIWTACDVMHETHWSYIHYMDNNRCYR